MARYEVDPATGNRKRVDGTAPNAPDSAPKPTTKAPTPAKPKGDDK